jgi:hypothetical protein
VGFAMKLRYGQNPRFEGFSSIPEAHSFDKGAFHSAIAFGLKTSRKSVFMNLNWKALFLYGWSIKNKGSACQGDLS